MNFNDVIESSTLDLLDESESVFCYCAWGKKRKKRFTLVYVILYVCKEQFFKEV